MGLSCTCRRVPVKKWVRCTHCGGEGCEKCGHQGGKYVHDLEWKHDDNCPTHGSRKRN